MATFGTVQLPDWTKVNSLFDNAANAIDVGRARLVNSQASTSEQDLVDRATRRGLASGLNPANIDPSAIGTALSIPTGTEAVNSLTEYGKGQLVLGAMPVMPYGAGGAARTSVNPLMAQPASGDDTFIDKLAPAEAGSPQTVNKGGFNGQYQFGVPRLTELGVYTPSDGEIGQGGKWNGKTGGTFDIPSFPDVKTQTDFLQGPVGSDGKRNPQRASEAQRAVMHLQVSDLDKLISNLPGAGNFNRTGLLAVGHLGGPTGLTRFVQSNGAYNPNDGRTSLMDYYKRFSSGGPEALRQAYGHSDGPLPGDHAFHGTQVASNAPTNTATDASPAAWDGVQQLVAGYRQPAAAAPEGVAADPGYLANRNAPVAGQGMTAPQAVAQATSELGDQINRMDPAAANAAVTNRAQQLLAGGGQAAPAPVQAAPASGLQPSSVPVQPAPMPQQASIASAPQPVAATAPAQQPAPAQAQRPTYGPTLDTWPAGTRPVSDRLGRPYRAPGTPEGMTTVQAPDGTMGAVRMTGVQAPLQFTKTPTHIIASDKTSGAIVSMTPIPETGRGKMEEVPGGHQMYINGHAAGPVVPFSGQAEQRTAYKEDQDKAHAMTQTALEAQATMPRLNEMADIARGLATGPTAELRAKAQAVLESVGIDPAQAARVTGMSSASAAQEFMKLALSTAGGAAKADLGANNGIQSTQLYMNANPGMALMKDANMRMTNMLRVGMQAKIDYAEAGLSHFADNEANIQGRDGKGSKTYIPLTAFDRAWISQNNPQVYAAAMGILNKDPYDKWAERLHDPELAKRAASIAVRVDPNIQVPVAGGKMRAARELLGAQ